MLKYCHPYLRRKWVFWIETLRRSLPTALSTIRPERSDHPRKEENRGEEPCECSLAFRWFLQGNERDKWDSGWQNYREIRDSSASNFTKTGLHPKTPDQAVVWWGEVDFFFLNHWRLLLKVDGQCFPCKLFMWPCWPYHDQASYCSC